MRKQKKTTSFRWGSCQKRAFIAGVTSDATKKYWYKQFKKEL